MNVRISKFIADTGAASRRGAEELIAARRVSVNGRTVDTPVFFVAPGDVVAIDGTALATPGDLAVYAFHKPLNTMTTRRDPAGRKTIYDCLPDEYKNLKYVGRLDYKTTGLLLMTNDGDVVRKMTLPASNIARTYIAHVGNVDLSGLARARNGITVDGIRYRPMKIDEIGGGNLRITVTEGKKNEIRIVLRACGAPVRKLHRISFGNIKLSNLPVGQIRKINQKTIDAMLKSL